MKTDLLEPLQILTHLRVKLVGQELTVLSVDPILLSVKEPVGDLELGGVLDDGDDSLELIGVELSGTKRGEGASSVLCPREARG